jgi:hypothetical protein
VALDDCGHLSDRRGGAGIRFHQTDLDDGHRANLVADDHRRRASGASDGQSPAGSSAPNIDARQPVSVFSFHMTTTGGCHATMDHRGGDYFGRRNQRVSAVEPHRATGDFVHAELRLPSKNRRFGRA